MEAATTVANGAFKKPKAATPTERAKDYAHQARKTGVRGFCGTPGQGIMRRAVVAAGPAGGRWSSHFIEQLRTCAAGTVAYPKAKAISRIL